MHNTILSAATLMLAVALVASAAAAADEITPLREHQGRWLGELTLPNTRVVKSGVDVYTRADGSVWASYASPDRDAYDIPVENIQSARDKVQLELPFAKLTLTWRGDHFAGEWSQNNEAALPIEFLKVAEFPRRSRPQDPQPPFPYAEQTLAIASSDGVMLGATLSVPAHVTRPDAVILVHGSGPQTRDEEGDGHRSFAVLADQLARQGIAVLRYDKRGVGRSTGSYAEHTQQDLVNDLHAAIAALRIRNQFQRIGVIGHSEGPMIAAALAARHPASVDFIVSLGGVGLPGIDMILLQDKAYATDQGAHPDELPRLMRYARRGTPRSWPSPSPGRGPRH